MLLKLSSHISNCLERAANAERRAQRSTDSAARSDNELLAQSWRYLARSYQFVESLQGFLSETDRNNKKIIPPEMLALIEEQPVAPEGPPVIRRRRIKHEASFRDRLLKSAQDAREQAALLPPGAERDRLLQRARQNETAANIDTWISSPGSHPPDHLELAKKPRG